MLIQGPTQENRPMTVWWLALAAIAVLVLLASPLQAQGAENPPNPAPAARPLSLPLSFADAAAREHAQTNPGCTCRAQGQSYQLGTQICLQGALFRCAMDLNVTSWQSLREPCPQS